MGATHLLYIDDSGSRFPDRRPALARTDGMDHFALGGVLIAEADIASVHEAFFGFCTKWNIDYPLHSSDIRGKRNDFAWLQDDALADKFLKELNTFIQTLPALGFAAVVHRPGYNTRYEPLYGEKRWWMCKTAFSILVERVVKHVSSINGTLAIRFEMCGKREDAAIIQYSKDLKAVGMPFNPSNSAAYGALTAADFKKILLGDPRGKKKRNIGIQIADLFLYPMAKHGYEPGYRPWLSLFDAKKVIDAVLPAEKLPTHGIKYSCFGQDC
ncbi:MAG: DUF3800 domain-containing protein [Patescibacteria group bacterium]|nr:MAG: DUF3800 domain-containing protein [Patescibacteria group bacterium]